MSKTVIIILLLWMQTNNVGVVWGNMQLTLQNRYTIQTSPSLFPLLVAPSTRTKIMAKQQTPFKG